MIIGYVYIILGLCLLAMTFDLMQQEIIVKFVWLGQKIGLVGKEDEDENGENEELLTDLSVQNDLSDISNDNMKKKLESYGNEKSQTLATEKPKIALKKIPLFEEKTSLSNNAVSPAPLNRSNTADKDFLRQIRSAYLQNLVQRQNKK